MIDKKPYRGTRDLFPEDKRIQDFLFQRMVDTAHSFGYECYDGPLLEHIELYRAKSGEELVDEQTYAFMDRGGREVAIRPEMTPTLARMIAVRHRETPKPIRWFSLPNLMRYERPQKGRLREHWQFNCDIFGAPANLGELEILQVLVHFLESLGAGPRHFAILLNDRRIVNCVFSRILEADAGQCQKLYRIVDKAKKIPPDALEAKIQDVLPKNSGRLLDYLAVGNFGDLRTFLEDNGQGEVYGELAPFLALLGETSLDRCITFDPTVVRGVDYYTGIVFEVFDKHPNNRRAICGGGSYANLLTVFDEPPLPGIGFGMGDVTLIDFLKNYELLGDFSRPVSDIFLSFQSPSNAVRALNTANRLRKLGLKITAGLAPLKTKKAFAAAEKAGASFVGFIGDEDVLNLKDRETGNVHAVAIPNLDDILPFIRGEAP